MCRLYLDRSGCPNVRLIRFGVNRIGVLCRIGVRAGELMEAAVIGRFSGLDGASVLIVSWVVIEDVEPTAVGWPAGCRSKGGVVIVVVRAAPVVRVVVEDAVIVLVEVAVVVVEVVYRLCCSQ